MLAMFEFFSLGDAIGHRAYRIWTSIVTILLLFSQYLMSLNEIQPLGDGLSLQRMVGRFDVPVASSGDVFFIFLIGHYRDNARDPPPAGRSASRSWDQFEFSVGCCASAFLRNPVAWNLHDWAVLAAICAGDHVGWRHSGVFRWQGNRATSVCTAS